MILALIAPPCTFWVQTWQARPQPPVVADLTFSVLQSAASADCFRLLLRRLSSCASSSSHLSVNLDTLLAVLSSASSSIVGCHIEVVVNDFLACLRCHWLPRRPRRKERGSLFGLSLPSSQSELILSFEHCQQETDHNSNRSHQSLVSRKILSGHTNNRRRGTRCCRELVISRISNQNF